MAHDILFWVFHQEQLDKSLAEHVARRQAEGATEQQAKDEAAIIQLFLAAGTGRALQGGRAK